MDKSLLLITDQDYMVRNGYIRACKPPPFPHMVDPPYPLIMQGFVFIWQLWIPGKSVHTSYSHFALIGVQYLVILGFASGSLFSSKSLWS